MKEKDFKSLISIITPCLNRASYVEEAVRSVINQGYPRVEHIVVDGGSSDDTLGILYRYPHLHVLSEPDSGLYDAINKGVRIARGEVIGLLNSDDCYSENCFEEIGDLFAENSQLDMVYGNAVVFGIGNGDTVRIIERHDNEFLNALTLRNAILSIPIINARFIRRRVYEKVGLFDTQYEMAADRDFLIRAALSGLKCAYIDKVIYLYRMHRESKTLNAKKINAYRLASENILMAERYMSSNMIEHSIKSLCRRWHGEYSITAIAAALQQGNLIAAGRCYIRAWKQNPFWLSTSIFIVLSKIIRRASLAAS
jgi:Glycosyltransferases, probably involved in cell wall biogenesis